MSNKITTTVKWFDNAKGYGFLHGPDGEDVFVHYQAIIGGEGYKTLSEGQQVEFLRVRSEKGWQAAEVVPLPSRLNWRSPLTARARLIIAYPLKYGRALPLPVLTREGY